MFSISTNLYAFILSKTVKLILAPDFLINLFRVDFAFPLSMIPLQSQPSSIINFSDDKAAAEFNKTRLCSSFLPSSSLTSLLFQLEFRLKCLLTDVLLALRLLDEFQI